MLMLRKITKRETQAKKLHSAQNGPYLQTELLKINSFSKNKMKKLSTAVLLLGAILVAAQESEEKGKQIEEERMGWSCRSRKIIKVASDVEFVNEFKKIFEKYEIKNEKEISVKK